MTQRPFEIGKVYFMIHPCAWAAAPEEERPRHDESGRRAADWYTAYNWEREVNRRQHRFIDAMAPDEALVIYPIGSSEAMRELEDHGTSALGRRCLVARPPSAVPLHHEPKVLHEIEEPIKHFLEDEAMEGREAFWAYAPADIRNAVVTEIDGASGTIGYDWNPSALNAIVINHMYAQEIADEFEKSGLVVDPATVRAEAFGEGFEQCAMVWKSMIPGHLNWSHPIENNFDLSVSGAQVLFDARLQERLSLENDVRLFLWQKSHGVPLGLFARAQARLAEQDYDVEVPLDGAVLEAWGVRGRMWPGSDSALQVRNGCLVLPVFSATMKRRDETCYLLGCNVSYDRFRDLLAGAAIKQSPA